MVVVVVVVGLQLERDAGLPCGAYLPLRVRGEAAEHRVVVGLLPHAARTLSTYDKARPHTLLRPPPPYRFPPVCRLSRR